MKKNSKIDRLEQTLGLESFNQFSNIDYKDNSSSDNNPIPTDSYQQIDLSQKNDNTNENIYSISTVAQILGLSIQMVRNYTSNFEEFLPGLVYSSHKHRLYTNEDIAVLKKIDNLRKSTQPSRSTSEIRLILSRENNSAPSTQNNSEEIPSLLEELSPILLRFQDELQKKISDFTFNQTEKISTNLISLEKSLNRLESIISNQGKIINSQEKLITDINRQLSLNSEIINSLPEKIDNLSKSTLTKFNEAQNKLQQKLTTSHKKLEDAIDNGINTIKTSIVFSDENPIIPSDLQQNTAVEDILSKIQDALDNIPSSQDCELDNKIHNLEEQHKIDLKTIEELNIQQQQSNETIEQLRQIIITLKTEQKEQHESSTLPSKEEILAELKRRQLNANKPTTIIVDDSASNGMKTTVRNAELERQQALRIDNNVNLDNLMDENTFSEHSIKKENRFKFFDRKKNGH